MNEPDVDDYGSFLIAYAEFTDEERKAYWKRENAKENLTLINSLHHNISINDRLIRDTKRWLRLRVDDYTMIDEPTAEETAKLKADLTLGAELIQGCEADTGKTRAEIAFATRYPLYSEKRRQWYQKTGG